MDAKELKNAPFIKDVEDNKNKLRVIREHFEASYNNEYSKRVALAIRSVEHLMEDHQESLK